MQYKTINSNLRHCKIDQLQKIISKERTRKSSWIFSPINDSSRCPEYSCKFLWIH